MSSRSLSQTSDDEEAKMHVKFGASVFGIGGKRLGEVNGVIVDAGTKRARAILLTSGPFDGSKQMVDITAIARADDDGLHLESTRAVTDAESPVLDSEEVAFPERVQEPTTFIPAAGVGGPVYADTPAVPGQYPDESSFFEIAPLDPPPVEILSNLGPNEVILGNDSHAISSDDHQLGKVVALELGEREVVEGMTVSEGFIFKERSNFSLSEIDEFGTNEVHLKLTKAQAEAR
jgi:hypothetical protein